VDNRAAIPGGGNGLAAASPRPDRIEVFAMTGAGIEQYSFTSGAPLSRNPLLPSSGGLPTRLLAAVSTSPGTLDVFAVDPATGMPLRWHFDGGWSSQLLGVPGLHRNSGLAPVVLGPGRIGLFGIGSDANIWSCLIDGAAATLQFLPRASLQLPEGVPAVIGSGDQFDLFAIAQGGPLVHWRLDGRLGGPAPAVYDANLAGGGLTATSGPTGLEVFGIRAGGGNNLLHWPAGIAAADHKPWVNWGGNQRTQPEGVCAPATLEELVAIVRSAVRANKRVRAVGSSWSLSDVAAIDGFVVETSKLDRVLKTVVPKALVDAPRSIVETRRITRLPDPNILRPEQLVHVEAGIQVEQLMRELDARHLAPATMGGSSGQTLAGVLSTSVHGCHFGLPPFPDWVRALHLVGPDGAQYWIEPADNPITKNAELQQALGPDVTVVRDDNWYNATIAAVGSLGILYSVVLEVREEYKIKVSRTLQKWETVRSWLADGSLFTRGAPDSVYVSLDPGESMASGNPDCYVTSRVSVAKEVASKPGTPDTLSDGLAAFCNAHHFLPITWGVAAATPAIWGGALAALGAVPGLNLALPAVAPLIAALTPVLATADLAVPLLIEILKLGRPGAVGDFIGLLLDGHPAETAKVISQLTGSQQPVGADVAIDDAHKAMAPWDNTACVARGLALEVALDTPSGAHIRYADAVVATLRDEAAQGRYLGGWISMRFVGTSRAFLSPHKSTITCTVEYTALRTLSSSRPLLQKLEALGRDFNGIQHWGMFLDLTAGDVARAYPQLDAWREVRWKLTKQGSIKTFDSQFTRRCGLSLPPGKVHVVAFHDGRLAHTIRTDVGWQPWGDIFRDGGAGELANVTQTASAGESDRLHVVALHDGRLAHTIRTEAGWKPWGDVFRTAGAGDLANVTQVAIGGQGNRLHVVALHDGRLAHTIRSDAGFQQWGDIFRDGGAGELANVIQVAVTGDGNRLHVVALHDGRLAHTIRTEEGWQPWGDLFGAAGDLGNVTQVAVAAEGNRLHVVALHEGRLAHTIRTDAGWQPWGDVFSDGRAGELANVMQVAVAGEGNRLHVIALHSGRLAHTFRTDSGWLQWGDVFRDGHAGELPNVVQAMVNR